MRSMQAAIKADRPADHVPPRRPPEDPVPPILTPADTFEQAGGTLAQVIKALSKPKPPEVTPAVVVPPVEPTAVIPPVVPATPAAPAVPDDPTMVKIREMRAPTIPTLPKGQSTTSLPTGTTLDVTGLDDDERSEVETAQYAERAHPEKYTGHAAKVLQFIKDHKKVVSEIEATGEGDVEDNPRYKSFVKANRPGVTTAERRKLEQERMAYEAGQKVKAEVSEQVAELRKQLQETRAQPVVDKAVSNFKEVVSAALPKDDELARQISNRIEATAATAAGTFLRLTNQLEAYDHSNPLHKWTADFIEGQATVYQKSGHPSLKRGNQSFVSRATYNQMAANDRAKHFTFSDDDVIQILGANAKMAAEEEIRQERARLEAAGYVRKAATPATPPPVSAAQVVLDPSPRAGAAPSPSAPNDSRPKKDGLLSYLRDGALTA